MRRLARYTLLLYPLAFRRRYGDEMCALLERTRVRPMTLLDLVRGALVAHYRAQAALAGLVDGADRMRASASGVLACWVVFAAAGFGFYKTTEDAPFTTAAHAHPLLGVAHVSVQALSVVGSVAVLAGALPLILPALKQARRDPGLRLRVSLPVIAALVFVGLTGLLVVAAHSEHGDRPSTAGGLWFIAWGLAGLGCAAVCVLAARASLFAMAVSRGSLVWALACGRLVAAAMVGMALATVLYTVALTADASYLAGSPNGPLQAMSVGASLVVQGVVMVLAAALATGTTRRGGRAAA